MTIDKIINNNVIASHDQENKEIVVMGCGIGFHKKLGEQVDEHKIEKIFRIESQANMQRFKDMLAELPIEYIRISNEIVTYAKEKLDAKLSQNVYLTLTDHISFAIERIKKGMQFSNALYEEVKRFYREEFLIGLHALDIIREKLGVILPDDEAASIALHIVNAEFDTKVRDTYTITQILQDIMNLIDGEMTGGMKTTRQKMDLNSENESAARDRLLISLKLLAHRMLLLPEPEKKEESEFHNFVKEQLKQEYLLVERINERISSKYDCFMTAEEKIYLALDIKRMNDTK